MGSIRGNGFIKQFGIFYLAGFAVILGLKLFYSNAGSDELLWILAPTAWWARALSGIAFEYQPHVGYVSHACRFVIASSCSGVQFMIITIATLIFSYVHRMKTAKKGIFWLAFCLAGSYLFTVFVNGIRIVISIYLPMAVSVHGIGGRLGPERLHTVIGIGVYFTSLFLIYLMAERLSGKIAAFEFKGWGCNGSPPIHDLEGGRLPEAAYGEGFERADDNSYSSDCPRAACSSCSSDGCVLRRKVSSHNSHALDGPTLQGEALLRNSCSSDGHALQGETVSRNSYTYGWRSLRGKVCKCAPPIFWYFFIVLGIPFLNGAFQNNPKSFVEYAALMTVVCFAIVSVYCLLSLFKTRRSAKQNG